MVYDTYNLQLYSIHGVYKATEKPTHNCGVGAHMIGESLSFVSLSSQLRRIDVQGQTTSPTGKPNRSDQSHGKQLQGGDRPVIWRWFITTIKYIYIKL